MAKTVSYVRIRDSKTGAEQEVTESVWLGVQKLMHNKKPRFTLVSGEPIVREVARKFEKKSQAVASAAVETGSGEMTDELIEKHIAMAKNLQALDRIQTKVKAEKGEEKLKEFADKIKAKQDEIAAQIKGGKK